jgi:Ligand-gated ion channel.
MRKNTTQVDPKNIIFDKGLEIQILTELAKSINSSLKFRDAPPDGGKWGWDLGNGTWNGVTGEIASRYSDISAALLWYRCHLVTEIECLRPHLIDKVRWHVPCATPYPRWMSLTRVFTLSLWLGIITAHVIISAIMWQVAKITSHIFNDVVQNHAYSTFGKCFFNFWAIIIEESASNAPNGTAVRAIFLAWVLYCWAINNVYQAYLTSFLIDPGLQHQLSSEDEMLTSGIEYSTETSVISLYTGLLGTRYRHIIATEDVQTAEKRVEKGTLALLFSMFLVQYDIALEYMDADGKPRICDIEDDFAFNLVTMFVPKGSPFKARYDQVILYLMQAGLVNFWWEELKYTATLEKAGDFNLPPGEYIALKMDHLQSAFYFLFLGYALSVTSFLLELSWQYRKKYKIKRIETKRN